MGILLSPTFNQFIKQKTDNMSIRPIQYDQSTLFLF